MGCKSNTLGVGKMAACVCVYDDDFPRSPKTEMVNSTNPVAFFSLSLSLSILYSCYFVLPSSRLLKKTPKVKRSSSYQLLSRAYHLSSYRPPDGHLMCVIFHGQQTGWKREREGESIKDASKKKEKKYRSENIVCHLDQSSLESNFLLHPL